MMTTTSPPTGPGSNNTPPVDLKRFQRVMRGPEIRFLLTDKQARVGVFATAATLVLAYVLPELLISPLVMDHGAALNGPSATHLFGTDELGRDLLSRTMTGLRASVNAGLVAIGLACVLGIPFGLIAGYGGGIIDRIMMRFADALLAFPTVILGIATAVVLGPGPRNAIIAIGIALTPQLARLIRAQTLSEKAREYVQASRAIGAPHWRTIIKEILPNNLSVVIVFVAVTTPRAVLIEASLGFLGLSHQPPQPSLGGLVSASRNYLGLAPWYGIAPGLVLVILVASLSLLGVGVADAIDPDRRKGFRAAFR